MFIGFEINKLILLLHYDLAYIKAACGKFAHKLSHTFDFASVLIDWVSTAQSYGVILTLRLSPLPTQSLTE
jgi:hypothetical protein